MPISLPPISRRKFLRRSLGAGAGLLLGNTLFAATRRDEHSWALLADTHIAADRKLVAHDVNMTDNLVAVTNQVIQLSKRPAGVLICGDCAFNKGEKGDYAVLTELLQPLRKAGLPIHLALGNHDERNHFRAALKEAKGDDQAVVDRHIAIVKTSQANWFILDSLDKTLSTPGLLGENQLAWLAKALDKNDKKPALVLVHHNPADGVQQGALIDTEGLFKVIRPRKQVKAYFFGHTHRWKIDQDPSGIHLINLPTTAYIRETGIPNGWVHATLLQEGVRLELRCLNPSHPAHQQTVNLKWRT